MNKLVWTSSVALAAMGLIPMQTLAQENDSIKLAQLQEVTVKGVRAQKNAPFAVANLNKEQLSQFSNSGRELPLLFAQTPGILAWGENGLGTGTTYMRIRGAAGSRINVTLDGVALNSPEDQTVFWANMNSYASLMGSVQLQRGIGTSTNGDGAFGGSISLQTAAPSERQTSEYSFSYGSYNTFNYGFKFSTGLLWDHLMVDAAWHQTSTDGYLHGTNGRSGSYYGALTWLGSNFRVSYKNIGNFETTGQAWNGVTAGNDDYSMNSYLGIRTYKDMVKAGLGKYNSLYEGFEPDWNGGWETYRYKMDDGTLWDRATDNFNQDHNILSASWQPNAHWSHSAALHYTYGHGYYSEFKHDYKFKKFGIVPINAGQMYDLSQKIDPVVKKGDFVRRKGLTQHTYGLVYTANYTDARWDILGGINLQQFRGNHYGYLDYISNVGQEDGKVSFLRSWTDSKYYDSDARKGDYSAYVKGTYHITPAFDAFADLQYRHVDYKTTGINDKFYQDKTNGLYNNQSLDFNEHYNFINPKAGLSLNLNGHKAYASVAYASREPERNNFTDNGGYAAPNAEHLLDFELGYSYTGSNWHAGANFYYMDYKDQFVQTGQKSDIGESLTTNIDKSYRMGVELTADWSPLRWLTVAGNAALSQNKIKDFDEVVETYDADWNELAPTTVHYDNSTLAFSPSAILNGMLTVHHAGFEATWHTNFVSQQYMDNTENDLRALPCFSQTDIHLGYTLNLKKRPLNLRQVLFGLNMNNIFSRHYAVSGWAYSAIVGKDYPVDHRYYQLGYNAMAGFTMMGNVTLKF